MTYPITHKCEQGSPEWLYLRTGKVTASGVGKICAQTKAGKKTSEYDNYLLDIMAERITGDSAHTYVTPAMMHGMEYEAEARDFYRMTTGSEVQEVGFIEYNEHIGVSPDGIIGSDGVLEIKCPTERTQIKRVMQGPHLPDDHKWQVLALMHYGGFEYCDFVSYHPKMGGKWQYFQHTVAKTDYKDDIQFMVHEVNNFLQKVINSLSEE